MYLRANQITLIYHNLFMFDNYHLVGVGGISMSGIAKVLLAEGKKVSGSDLEESKEVIQLKNLGIKVAIGHNAENIENQTQCVVVSAAIEDNNPEVIEAKRRNIPVWRRSQLIGYSMREKIGIAVAGMHGKSTISAMLASILEEAGEDPTVLVGAYVDKIGSNAKYGKGDLMVVEACEYKRSFLDFYPTVAVISNIEEEHLDTYRDLDDIKETFKVFAAKIPEGGLLVSFVDDKNVLEIIKNVRSNLVGYGFNKKPVDFDGVYWQIVQIERGRESTTFRIEVDGHLEELIYKIVLPGDFNILNAVAALIVCDFLVIDSKAVLKALEEFTGAGRRLQVLGKKDDVVVVDDYGHHPTEIVNCLKAIKQKYPDRHLWVVFQPHQYSRTFHFLDGFASSFSVAEKVVVPEIYRVRDSIEDIKKVNSKILVERIVDNGVDAVYIPDFDKIVQFLNLNIPKQSVLLVLGAGPVNEIGKKFLKQ